MGDGAQTETKQHREPQAHQPVGPQLQTLQPQLDTDSLVARASLDPGRLTPSDVLHLQRTVGNRAVSQMLAAGRQGPGPLQAKLTVGPVGDRYEQEADRVAEQVLAAPRADIHLPTTVGEGGAGSAPHHAQRQEEEEEIQTKPFAASITPLVQRAAEKEDANAVQTKPLVQRRADGSFEADPGIEGRLAARRGAGAPLPHDTRTFMERRFGADFNKVRVHTDPEAGQISRKLGAQALTYGQDIYVGTPAPSPPSADGQRLLAHELTHVVQQGAAPLQRQELPNAGQEVSQRQVDATGAVSAIPAAQRPNHISLLHRSSFIQRLGTATRLRGISTAYDTERTTQRPDLRKVVEGYGRCIKKLYQVIQEIGPLDAANVAGLATAKNKLKDPPTDPMLKAVYDLVETKDKAGTLSDLNRIHDTQLEKAQLQDIVIDEQGNLDATALATRMVKYDETAEAQEKTLVNISGGHLKRSATHATPNADVDTGGSVTQHSGKGWEIFVVGANSDVHMASHKIGAYHHSSLLGGAPVSMAGEMKVRAGRIVTMSNKSGHYTPGPEHFQHFLRTIENAGIALDFNVMGWGVPAGRADTWLNSLSRTQTPEFKDTEFVWESWQAAGKRPKDYLLGPPPGGLGWRINIAYASHLEQPNGSGGWKEVTHDDVRRALEAHFGPAPKKVEREGAGITWL